jgi:general secretion pathway protein A
MYNGFFGFRERPFQLTPNPRFLYLNSDHREALATLRFGLSSSLGITLLIGDAGTGKTTLLRAAITAEQRPNFRHVVINNPTLSVPDFYEVLARAFDFPESAAAKGRFLLTLEDDLRQRHAEGGVTTLVVDEAHSLTHELFEEIRLLANIETPTAKLLNLLLVGQPELGERLNDDSLRQFKQRVVLRCALSPLDIGSTAGYIATRLRVAGAAAVDVFTKEAVRAIHDGSRGIPRTIGVICENALLAGFAAGKKPVDRATILEVCRDLDLSASNGNGHQPSDSAPLVRRHARHYEPPPDTQEDDAPAPSRWKTGPWFRSRQNNGAATPQAEREAEAPTDRTRIFKF